MEITKLSETAIRIKGKYASCIINPIDLRSKVSVSSAIFFQQSQEVDLKFFETEPVIIQGPGEYETGGIKITGSKMGDLSRYRIAIDGIDILATKISALGKAKESVAEYKILLLEADILADQSIITALNPSVVIFYGEKREENAKATGKEAATVSKYSVTKEKLPSEEQIIILQ